jgi:hypothetical protein
VIGAAFNPHHHRTKPFTLPSSDGGRGREELIDVRKCLSFTCLPAPAALSRNKNVVSRTTLDHPWLSTHATTETLQSLTPDAARKPLPASASVTCQCHSQPSGRCQIDETENLHHQVNAHSPTQVTRLLKPPRSVMLQIRLSLSLLSELHTLYVLPRVEHQSRLSRKV